MRGFEPNERRLVKFSAGETAVHVESIRQRAERIRRGLGDPVDLLPGRLVGDIELLLAVVGERQDGANGG